MILSKVDIQPPPGKQILGKQKAEIDKLNPLNREATKTRRTKVAIGGGAAAHISVFRISAFCFCLRPLTSDI
jgi:hypothetical protein